MFLLNRCTGSRLWKISCNRIQQTQRKVQVSNNLANGPVFRNAQFFPEKMALRDRIAGYTYANILASANELSKDITKLVDGQTGERVMFMCSNDVYYVITLWAIWMSGQIAVPLSPHHPENFLLYYANDTYSKLIVTTSEYADLIQMVSRNTYSLMHVLDDKMRLNCAKKSPVSQSDLDGSLPLEFYDTSDALILYTSGTTGNPKGVVLSHKNLECQIETMRDAWKWTKNDVILHTLPLNHVHGIVYALLCPLYVGATIIMLNKFNAKTVWSYMLGINEERDDTKISVFMAVPTIYSMLIEEFERVFKNDAKMVEYIMKTLKNKVRLMVSGSAPLLVPVYERWLEISGHRILERYRMTETGMVLSNEYDSNREPGFVGIPLPGVSVRLVEEVENSTELKVILECTNNDDILDFSQRIYESNNQEGELLVKGDGIFKEYFNRPEVTYKEFTSDGWFRTGDLCEYVADKKKFRILGRKSVDIIKSGGYKLSAVQIEVQLLTHPDIKECVVVGVDDEKWGQRVAAIVVLRGDKKFTLEDLRSWAKEKMPSYWVPSILKVVTYIPKNALGKTNKKELVKVFM